MQQRADAISERGARTLNAEQRLAVAAHLCGAGGRVPFALFGPPGTGKTVTLVECALQVRQAGCLPLSVMPLHALGTSRAIHWVRARCRFAACLCMVWVHACLC